MACENHLDQTTPRGSGNGGGCGAGIAGARVGAVVSTISDGYLIF